SPPSLGAMMADLAIQALGAAAIPIDPGVRSAALVRMLQRTEPRQIFVCDLAQLDRVIAIRPDLPSLELVLLLAALQGEEVAAAMHVDRVRARGAERLRAHPGLLHELRDRIAPDS